MLIITIPTSCHERLHSGVYTEIFSQIVSQGLKGQWITMAATQFDSGGRRKSSKEPDSAGGPRAQRADGKAWPTLVIEGGYSESHVELRNDIHWWFRESHHQVKIVILAKLFKNTSRIVLEKWQEVSSQRMTRATSTTSLIPSLDQEITINQSGPDPLDPASYSVTRGALRLSFELLFLRAPGAEEHDFIVSIEDLQRVACDAWR